MGLTGFEPAASLCESDVITARPQAIAPPNCIVSYYIIAGVLVEILPGNILQSISHDIHLLLEERFLLCVGLVHIA